MGGARPTGVIAGTGPVGRYRRSHLHPFRCLLGCRADMHALWAALAIVGAAALAIVTGLLNPAEKVNGLWLVVAAGCLYALALRFYGRFLARRVVELDDDRVTPAHRLQDGKNFYPANRSEERRVGKECRS